MAVPRAVQIPYVTGSPDPGMVVTRLPSPAEHAVYYETTMTPDEALRYAADLIEAALRAKELSGR